MNKAIFFDVDNTLVCREENTICESTIRAIEKLKNNKDINLSHFSYINKGENVILKCEDIDIERIEKIIQSIEQQNNKNLLK